LRDCRIPLRVIEKFSRFSILSSDKEHVIGRAGNEKVLRQVPLRHLLDAEDRCRNEELTGLLPEQNAPILRRVTDISL
jgi:hypothetical protein